MIGDMVMRPVQTLVPTLSRPLRADVLNAAWYPMHQTSGTTLADKLGLAPTLTLAGAGEATVWSATWGAATPNGSDQRWYAPQGNPYMQALMRLDTLAGQQLCWCYELQHDGDTDVTETIFGFGRAQNLAGCGGQWGIQMSTGEYLTWTSHGGDGASNAIATTITATVMTGITARWLVSQSLLDLGDARTVRLRTRMARIDTGDEITRVMDFDLLSLGGALPKGDSQGYFGIAARQVAPSTFDRYFGGPTHSAGSLNNIAFVRLSSTNDAEADDALACLKLRPRELPASWLATA